jgi:nicotinate-nucleotide adenylyltransferase
MNIGVYGGSFNPPHLGHLILAQSAAEQLQLDTVLFVPTYASPFKLHEDSIDAQLRCEMVELALSDNKLFRGEYWEAMRQETSWSIDTIRYLSRCHPGERLHLLMGADTFRDFHLWKEPEEISGLTEICVAERPGYSISDAEHAFCERAIPFSMPLVEISSTDIRRRVAEGTSIRYLVPWTVEVLIGARGLYRQH